MFELKKKMGVGNRKTENHIALSVLVIILIINPTCDGAAFDLVKGNNNTSITNIHCNGGQLAADEECLNIGGALVYLELLLVDSHSSRRRLQPTPPEGVVLKSSFTNSATETVPNCAQGASKLGCLEGKTCTGIFNCYPS